MMMTEHRRRHGAAAGALRRALIDIARSGRVVDEVGDALGVLDPGEVVAAARYHQIISLVHERIRQSPSVPPAVVGALYEHRLRLQLYHLHVQHVQALMVRNIDQPWMTIKGNAIAQWYPDPATRDFNDLDVLVRPVDFRSVLAALETLGGAVIGANWHGYRELEVAEIPLLVGSVGIDLHWHVVGLGDPRTHVNLPTEVLFERAETFTVGEDRVLTLDLHDTLLHVCLNVGLDGARRLRGLIDVDAVFRSEQLDPDELVRRARQARIGRLVAAVLQRTCLLLGTPMPDGLLRELAGDPLWMGANLVVDRLTFAVRRRATAGVASGILLSAGRDTRTASAWALALGWKQALERAAGRPGLTQPGGALDWQRRPFDGRVDAHRAGYLAWVAGQAGEVVGASSG